MADLAADLAALIDLPGRWIDKVHARRPPKIIVLDMDLSESPTYGEQEGSAYDGHLVALISPAVRVQCGEPHFDPTVRLSRLAVIEP